MLFKSKDSDLINIQKVIYSNVLMKKTINSTLTGKEVCKSLKSAFSLLSDSHDLRGLMDSLDNLHLSPFAAADYILTKDIIELFLIRKILFS